jgi:hypothetical protein
MGIMILGFSTLVKLISCPKNFYNYSQGIIFITKSRQCMNIKISLFKKVALSGLTADVAQVFFAALVVGQFLEREISIPIMVVGAILSLGFWGASLQFAKY